MDEPVNHYIFDDNNPVWVNTIRYDVEQKARKRMNRPLASETKTIKWSWITFLSKIECN